MEVADYEGLIRVGVQGLGRIRELNTVLRTTGELVGNIENALINTGQIAESATRNTNRAAARRAQARVELAAAQRTVENVEQRRNPRGQYISGPGPAARRMARASLALSQREYRESSRALREQEQNRRLILGVERRYVAARNRANASIESYNRGLQEADAELRRTRAGMRTGSRGNFLTNLFQGRGRAYTAGGSGVYLTPELRRQARNVRSAWDIATANGQEDLSLMSALATEQSGLNRQQREENRSRRNRSSAFEAARRGRERIAALEAMPGSDPNKIRALRSRTAGVIALSNRGDAEGARMRIEQMNAAISRYTRELNEAAQGLQQQRRTSFRDFNVRQSWRAVSAEAQRMAELRPRALPSGEMLASRIARTPGGVAPTRLDELEKERRKAARKEAERAEKDAADSRERFRKKQAEEERRRERLGIGGFAPSRIGGPVRRTGAIPMGGGADAGIMPRALPSGRMLEERVALSNQRQPARLDEAAAAAKKEEAKQAERAAGSVGRFAAAMEREEKRRASLGIGAPSRIGGPVRRTGAIPMGGGGGRPGMFDQYGFPAGPGNVYGEAEFKRIQKAQRQPAAPGFFRGDLRKAAGEGLIGGAFPLLFGQGLGASIGGGAGGFAGGMIGGSFGFGLSLVGTAVGAAVDTTTNNLKELASSLKSPNDTMQALEKSGFRVSSSLKLQVEQLQAVGRAYDAQTLVLQEVQKRLGTGAVRELNALESEQKRLQDQWSAIAGALQSELLPALVGFTNAINGIVGAARSVAELPGVKQVLAVQGALEKNPVGRAALAAANPAAAIKFSFQNLQERGRAIAAGKQGERQAISAQEAFADQGRRIEESRRVADLIRSAYREAFDLQRQAHDLQREGATLNKEIADYSYKKESEIFALQQQAAEKRIENRRGAAQNRIERGDLSARQAFAAATGFEQQLLTNVREVMRTRKEGEADIEQSRNRLELAMAKLSRDAEDYKRTNAREIEDIERRKLSYVRSVEDYKMKVSDYVRDRTREAADLWKQAMALPGAGAAGGGGTMGGGAQAGTVATPRTLMGVPGVIEYLTGDKSSPGYRADHGGSNYHEHIAFASRRIRDDVIAMLRKNGIVIGSTDGGRHAPNSYHYSGQAVDIPGAQVPVGQEDALARRVRSLIAGHLGGNLQRSAAAQISNIPAPRFTPVPIGPTPSTAPINAANMAANLQLRGGEKEAQRILEGQVKLRQKGIELAQVEQILQSSQLPQLQQQGEALRQQVEARQKILNLSDQAASVVDMEAEASARLKQIEIERKSAIARVNKQYKGDPEAIRQVNTQTNYALEIAEKEEKQRRLNLDLENQKQVQEQVGTEILQLQEKLFMSKAEAAALERGELEATSVELLKASTLYQKASEAQRAKLAGLALETQELEKQNEFNKRMNEMRREARFTGAGLRAGFIGTGAQAYEQGLKDFNGDTGRATAFAKQAMLIEDQKLAWDSLAKSIVDTSNAISGGLTTGLVDIVGGAKKIQDVGRETLNSIAGTFAEAAQQQLTTLLQRQLAGYLGGPEGVLTKMLGAGQAAGPQALAGASGAAATSLWGLNGAAMALGATLQTVAAQAAFSGALGSAGGISSAMPGFLAGFAQAPNLLGSIAPGFQFGGFLAQGGTTSPNKGYIVGENEPEFFFPGVSGRVVPQSDMEKAAELRRANRRPDTIDVSYTVTEQQGQRFVTEEQFRKSNAALLQRSQAATYAGMRNNSGVRDYVGI